MDRDETGIRLGRSRSRTERRQSLRGDSKPGLKKKTVGWQLGTPEWFIRRWSSWCVVVRKESRGKTRSPLQIYNLMRWKLCMARAAADRGSCGADAFTAVLP